MSLGDDGFGLELDGVEVFEMTPDGLKRQTGKDFLKGLTDWLTGNGEKPREASQGEEAKEEACNCIYCQGKPPREEWDQMVQKHRMRSLGYICDTLARECARDVRLLGMYRNREEYKTIREKFYTRISSDRNLQDAFETIAKVMMSLNPRERDLQYPGDAEGEDGAAVKA